MNCVPELVSATKICPQCNADAKRSGARSGATRVAPTPATMRDPAETVAGRSRRGIVVLAAGASRVGPLVGAMVARDVTREGSGALQTVRAADRLRPRPRSRAEIAEALYYQATAKAAQDDRAGACDRFRRAASSASGRLLTAVNVALEVCQ